MSTALKTLDIAPGDPLKVDPVCGLPETHHIFSREEIGAVNAALAIGRPLLVRGEPGTGKTQLARAVAQKLGRPYVQQTMDSRTETRDPLYRLDAVARLAHAQVSRGSAADVAKALALERFIAPGAMWWALNWAAAKGMHHQTGVPCLISDCDRKTAPGGVVALIDEIDKADPSVPNALLEALAHQRFQVEGVGEVARAKGQQQPLVLITTNDERALPRAFVRRCMVLRLLLPEDPGKLRDHLVIRARAHHDDADEAILRLAAEQLIADRAAAKEGKYMPPGLAEYLDLVSVVVTSGLDYAGQKKLLADVRLFTFLKHMPDEAFRRLKTEPGS